MTTTYHEVYPAAQKDSYTNKYVDFIIQPRPTAISKALSPCKAT
jgi:hypothetical protein